MLFTFALYTEDQTAGSAKSFSGAYRKAASCFFSPAFNISQPIAFFNYLFIKPDAVVCKMDPDCTRVFFPICYCNLCCMGMPHTVIHQLFEDHDNISVVTCWYFYIRVKGVQPG